MKKWDIILCVSLAFLALGLFILPSHAPGSHAVIEQNGKKIAVLPLGTDTSLVIGGNIIVVEAGKVSMQAADCPDGLCVGQGTIEKTGQSIICLPNKLLVHIDGQASDARRIPDTVAY